MNAGIAKYVTGVDEPVAMATLTYAAHAEGPGGAQKILAWARANGGAIVDVIKAYPGHVYNKLSGIVSVGKRSLLWEAAKPALLSGSLSGMRMLAGLGLVTCDGLCPSQRMAA